MGEGDCVVTSIGKKRSSTRPGDRKTEPKDIRGGIGIEARVVDESLAAGDVPQE